jgi:hypothetical protein
MTFMHIIRTTNCNILLHYACQRIRNKAQNTSTFAIKPTKVDSVSCDTRFQSESPKESDHLEDQGVDGRTGSKWVFGGLAGRVWIGFTWLRIGTGGRLL